MGDPNRAQPEPVELTEPGDLITDRRRAALDAAISIAAMQDGPTMTDEQIICSARKIDRFLAGSDE